MKIYLAAIEPYESLKPYIRHGLISVATGFKKIEKFTDLDLMIDSGAFTYYNQGKEIDIEEWIELVLPVSHHGQVVSLDVIGNAEQTYENYKKVREKIPDAMPTFHCGSDLGLIKKYLELTDKIAVGGVVPLMWSQKTKLFKVVMETCREIARINRKIKVHLFGIIHEILLKGYPFYSCDSATWVKAVAHGRMMKFDGQRIGYEYGLKQIGPTIHNLKDRNKRHIQSIKAFNDYEDFITNLWKKRGIIWQQ